MRLSQEADYAVRCVLHLCEHAGRPCLIDEIAGEMLIPRSFAAKILQKLVRAELVTSRRGVGGGFVLARDPRLVTLLQVVEAVDGPIALNRCVDEPRACPLRGTCATHPVWRDLTGLISGYLTSIDFAALVSGSPRPQVSWVAPPASEPRRKSPRRKSDG